jgi:uncharacterized membrane protein YphA (DoxX/SURF4 family)
MAAQPQLDVAQAATGPAVSRWSAGTRIAFRFCFIYFGLFCLTTQILTGLFPIPKIDIPNLAGLPPVRNIVFWTAAHVFRVSKALVYTGSGSGDKTFDWVLVFCALSAAAFATIGWSVLDGKRENYIALHKWFYVFLRFAVGSEMVIYGLIKVMPMQMPYPSLSRLFEPFGNFSPMGVLWFSIGASPAYERFVGSAELLGGVLLFLPRTATFGALICLADAAEIFALNMTYDVPVKLLSFHLILMSLVLLAPEALRIVRFFFTSGAVEPSTHSANRTSVAVQAVYGLLLIGLTAFSTHDTYHKFGGGAPEPPLYGIWNVQELSIDGQVRPPLLTDNDRWRRVLIDNGPRLTFQRPDDSFVGYGASIDIKQGNLELTKPSDKTWKALLKYQRPSHDQLTLDGNMDGRKVHMQLSYFDKNKLLLVSRGFHWIQEYPFNR